MPVFSSRPLETGPSDPELAAAGIPDTSPTWELELLICGAVLFALFQIPPVLNSFFAHIEPHATTTMLSAILLVQIYVKAIVYALTASFVVHLVARAYWVGLVGLHSVFPNGVKWENFKAGPVTLEVYRSDDGPAYLGHFYYVTSLGDRLSRITQCKLCNFLRQMTADPSEGTHEG